MEEVKELLINNDPKLAVIILTAGACVSLCTSIMEHNYKGKLKIGNFIDIELEPVS